MKKFKKIMAVLVAAMMIVATMVPAWAEQTATGSIPTTKGKITVTNARKDEVYKAYKMLTLISYNDNDRSQDHHATDAYAYAVEKDTDWIDFFTNTKKPTAAQGWPADKPWGSDYISLDTTNPITVDDRTFYVASLVDSDVFGNKFADTSSDSDDENYTGTSPSFIGNYASSSLVQEFAQAALDYAKDVKHISSPDAQATASAAGSLDLLNGSSTELELGYYLVDSSMGSLCTLDTTNNEVTVIDKNNTPASEKKGKEDGSLTDAAITDGWTGYQDVNDASVGQKVWYRGVINIEKGAQGYVYADKMDDGLQFNASDVRVYFLPNGVNVAEDTSSNKWIELKDAATDVKISADGDAYVAPGKAAAANNAQADFWELLEDSAYKHNWGTTPAVKSTFELKINDDFATWISDNITTIGDTSKIVIVYSATVKDTAKIGQPNWNRSTLHYGDLNFTTPDETATYVWPVEIFKYHDKDGDTTLNPLGGAVFALSDNAAAKAEDAISYSYDGTNKSGYYRFKKITSTDDSPAYDSSYVGDQYKVVPYDAGETEDTDFVTKITTNSTSGKVRIVGLDAGTYYLTEITAPNGYNKLAYPVKVIVSTNISASTEVTTTPTESLKYNTGMSDAGVYGSTYDVSLTAGDVVVPIENTTSTELPSTGGMGTTVLYIVGGMLVILAGAYLFFSRKRTA